MSRIFKCNHCGVIIDPKTTPYYEINEVTHHAKEGQSYRLVIEGKDKEETVERTESWAQWMDLDFCVPCFEHTGLARYIKNES